MIKKIIYISKKLKDLGEMKIDLKIKVNYLLSIIQEKKKKKLIEINPLIHI